MEKSKILKWSLIIGIVIVSNLFINYAISLVYKAPKWDAFCPTTQVVTPITNENECVVAGGQWIVGSGDSNLPVKYPQSIKEVGFCNETYTCQKNFSEALTSYERNVFTALVSIGVALIIISFFTRTNEVLNIALSLSGILSLVIASVRYWSTADNFLKVLILGVALAALIFLALRKFKNGTLRS